VATNTKRDARHWFSFSELFEFALPEYEVSTIVEFPTNVIVQYLEPIRSSWYSQWRRIPFTVDIRLSAHSKIFHVLFASSVVGDGHDHGMAFITTAVERKKIFLFLRLLAVASFFVSQTIPDSSISFPGDALDNSNSNTNPSFLLPQQD